MWKISAWCLLLLICLSVCTAKWYLNTKNSSLNSKGTLRVLSDFYLIDHLIFFFLIKSSFTNKLYQPFLAIIQSKICKLAIAAIKRKPNTEKKALNLLRFNNKYTKMLLTLKIFHIFCSVSIVDLKQANVCWEQ